ncbi:GntR family transcriptional regulator [Streptomyces sp. NPDC048254]|uniref:GntR family transcriptional regulator n=1 Tax=Streptomyces sp. NPDC048254 TaxID=3365525 RepID=UPI00371D5B25
MVHASVTHRVKQGEWPPGHVFTWPQVSEEFGVRIRAVGYAMQLLRYEKVVEARPHIGTRVVLLTGESWSPPGEERRSHAHFIEKAVRGRLADDVYRPGSLFPSLSCLAEEFGVSVATVRSGLRALKEANILEAVGNTGTFVTDRVRQLNLDALLECSPASRERGEPISACGESKSLHAWSKDPRCVVTFDVLKTRVIIYGWDLKRALESPKSEGAKKYAAFGEEKTLKEWTEDSRCQVSIKTLRERIRTGWATQTAIQSPLLL